jgi:prolipoprotein diacylglyceryltransferase
MKNISKKGTGSGLMTGLLFICIGVVSIIIAFTRNQPFTTLDIVKLLLSVFVVSYGLWAVIKSQKKSSDGESK